MSSIWDFVAGENLLHAEVPWLVAVLEWVVVTIEVFAILILVVGAARFMVNVTISEVSREETARIRGMNRERVELGRYILAGLELFIVSDIIDTVLTLTFGSIVFLALLVLIRSIISYFLDRELGELKRELGT